MTLPLDDLSLLDGPAGGAIPLGAHGPAAGEPLLLALDLIDEDPDQPRREFDEASLRELSETIALRGVRQPVSVRPHATVPGRWMLNFGARRYRASILAGKDTIPTFVDATADSFDQVIENEQRQSLTPLELALFVQKQQQAGLPLAEIARRLGKSRGYLTFVGALIDAPEWLMQLYRSGRCRGMTELYELRRLQQKHPVQIMAWLQGRTEVSRTDLVDLKHQLSSPGSEAALEIPQGRLVVRARTAREDPGHRQPARSEAVTARHAPPSPGQVMPPYGPSASGEPPVQIHGVWREQRLRIPLPTRTDDDGSSWIQALDESGSTIWVRAREVEQILLHVPAGD